MARQFRFGVNLLTTESRGEWAKKCRRAEQLGYDVVLVPDHLGWPAPFPALVAAAEATERPRVGTFVLNAGFWNPALLAREVATTDQLTSGRLELGLGTGYVRSEFEAAGLPWETPGRRVQHVERTIAELQRLFSTEDHTPRPLQRPRPPLLLGGNGDRMLRLAAAHADIMAFTGARQATGKPEGTLHLLSADEVGERVTAFRDLTAQRAQQPELNILVQTVVLTADRRAAARDLQAHAPHLTEDQLLEVPTLLMGTAGQIAERLRENRERFGFTYICVLEPAMEALATVMEELGDE